VQVKILSTSLFSLLATVSDSPAGGAVRPLRLDHHLQGVHWCNSAPSSPPQMRLFSFLCRWQAFFVAVLLISFVQQSSAIKVDIDATNEERRIFFIEEFGVLSEGSISIQVTDFVFNEINPPSKGGLNARAGFIVVRANSESDLVENLHKEVEEEFSKGLKCPLDDVGRREDASSVTLFALEFRSSDAPVNGNLKGLSKSMSKEVTPETQGLYEISFVMCGPVKSVSFKLHSEMVNPGPSYLSAGDEPLPTILFGLSIVFSGMLLTWVTLIKRHKASANKVHHLLTAFMMLKVLAMLAEAIDMHYIKVYGYSFAWNFLFHLLRALRAVMFFMVVVLIGTGWSLLKPALNDRERKILLCVLPLQLLANVALVIADELPRGSTSFMRWRELFLVIDLVCCFVVSLPIFFHIQHLEKTVEGGQKAVRNLAKLRQFRRFYLLVLVYVYFSRVVMLLLGSSLPFNLTWLQVIVRELGAIVFYVVIGHAFHPAADNKYLQVSSQELDDFDDTSRFDSEDEGDGTISRDHTSSFGIQDEDDIERSSPTRT